MFCCRLGHVIATTELCGTSTFSQLSSSCCGGAKRGGKVKRKVVKPLKASYENRRMCPHDLCRERMQTAHNLCAFEPTYGSTQIAGNMPSAMISRQIDKMFGIGSNHRLGNETCLSQDLTNITRTSGVATSGVPSIGDCDRKRRKTCGSQAISKSFQAFSQEMKMETYGN